MAEWTKLRYAVVDVEGNGQQLSDLVELGVVPIVAGNIGKPTSWLVKPPAPISYMARRIHGISNNDVADAPTFADIARQVREALDVDALIAHNAHVDLGVLRRHLTDWDAPEVFDTLKLAKRLLPDQRSYRLGALVETLSLADGLSADLTPHRATYDALVTARLFAHLATHEDGALRSLNELRGEPPRDGGDEQIIALF
jgi:DNA polymerase III epsilon subunit-like protein